MLGLQPQQPQAMPQISPELIEKAKRIVEAPSWEDISAIFRSDERRNYKISVSTDALEEEDDTDAKEQTLAFGKTIIEMMGAIIPGIQANPSLAPFSRELVMAVVKRFKVARPLEEALEDGLNQMSNQPQQPKPDPMMIKAQAELVKAQTDAEIAKIKAQTELMKQQGEIESSREERAHDAARFQGEQAIRAREVELEHQRSLIDLENKKLQTLLSLQKLGLDNRAQAMQEWETGLKAQDTHERRQSDITAQHTELALQAHDQANKHDIEREKIAAQREASEKQAKAQAQAVKSKPAK